MTKEQDLEKLKEFIGEDDYVLEIYTPHEGWNEWNYDSIEDVLEKIKKSDDYRVVKVFNMWDLGI